MILSAIRSRLALAVVVGLLAAPAVRGQDKEQPDQPGMLPSGESLMDKYIEATGGKEAYEKVKSVVMKGTLSLLKVGNVGTFTLEIRNPDQKHCLCDLKGAVGKVEWGSDGKIVWETSAQYGPKVYDLGKEENPMLGLDLNVDLKWRDQYKSAKTEKDEKFKGQDVYVVRLESKNGDTEYRYFDKKSGLLVRMKKAVKNSVATVMMDQTIGDYKKFGDLLIPQSSKYQQAGQEIEMRLASVEFNVDIPDSTFAFPDAIKELLKKKEKAPPNDPGK